MVLITTDTFLLFKIHVENTEEDQGHQAPQLIL